MLNSGVGILLIPTHELLTSTLWGQVLSLSPFVQEAEAQRSY